MTPLMYGQDCPGRGCMKGGVSSPWLTQSNPGVKAEVIRRCNLSETQQSVADRLGLKRGTVQSIVARDKKKKEAATVPDGDGSAAALTGEIVPAGDKTLEDASPEAQARAVTDAIRKGLDDVWKLVVQAWELEAWKSLGYDDWQQYVTQEFGPGKQWRIPKTSGAPAIAMMREAGMSSVPSRRPPARASPPVGREVGAAPCVPQEWDSLPAAEVEGHGRPAGIPASKPEARTTPGPAPRADGREAAAVGCAESGNRAQIEGWCSPGRGRPHPGAHQRSAGEG